MLRWLWISVGCAVVFLGCAYGEVRQVVRAQFAAELDCPEVQIQKRDVWYMYDSPDQYKVSGCGVMRTYTCPPGDELVSYDEPVCTWVEGDADAPVAPKPLAMDDEEDPSFDPEPVEEEPAELKPEAKPAPKDTKPARPENKPEAKPAQSKPEARPNATPAETKPKVKGEVKASGSLKLGGSGKKAK